MPVHMMNSSFYDPKSKKKTRDFGCSVVDDRADAGSAVSSKDENEYFMKSIGYEADHHSPPQSKLNSNTKMRSSLNLTELEQTRTFV